MGLTDAFLREDRAEITIAQLINILDDRAKMKAERDVVLKLCNPKNKITAPQIYKIFTEQQEEELQ